MAWAAWFMAGLALAGVLALRSSFACITLSWAFSRAWPVCAASPSFFIGPGMSWAAASAFLAAISSLSAASLANSLASAGVSAFLPLSIAALASAAAWAASLAPALAFGALGF